MIEKGNLNLFNLDDRCRGVYTWQRGTSRSVIDLVLVNEKVLGRMIGMEIDEERERIDISDHALIEIKIKGGRVEKENRKKWEKVEYCSVDKKDLEIYSREVEQRVRDKGIDSIRELNKVIGEVADEKLKKTYSRKLGQQKDSKDPPWVTEEVRSEIKERKRINRLQRNETNEQLKEQYGKQYEMQKEKVKSIVR